jgi:plastocyanin
MKGESMPFPRLFPLAVVGATLLTPACAAASSQAGTRTTIIASDFKFEPATVKVKAGEQLQIALRNAGMVQHDWSATIDGKEVHVHATAGKTENGAFMIQKPGTYQVICTQPGHEQAGMVGQIIVE